MPIHRDGRRRFRTTISRDAPCPGPDGALRAAPVAGTAQRPFAGRRRVHAGRRTDARRGNAVRRDLGPQAARGSTSCWRWGRVCCRSSPPGRSAGSCPWLRRRRRGWPSSPSAAGLGTTRGAALVAGAICVAVMGEFLLSLGGGLTEPMAAVPLAFALLATLAAGPTVRPGRALWVGALLGAGLLLSVQAAAGVVAIGVLMWIRGSRPIPAVAAHGRRYGCCAGRSRRVAEPSSERCRPRSMRW